MVVAFTCPVAIKMQRVSDCFCYSERERERESAREKEREGGKMKRPCHLQAVTNTHTYCNDICVQQYVWDTRKIERVTYYLGEESWRQRLQWGEAALNFYNNNSLNTSEWQSFKSQDERLRFDFEELTLKANFEVLNSLALIPPSVDDDSGEYRPGFVLLQPDKETYFGSSEYGVSFYITRVGLHEDTYPDRLMEAVKRRVRGQHEPSEVEKANLTRLLTLEKTFEGNDEVNKSLVDVLKCYILMEGAEAIK